MIGWKNTTICSVWYIADTYDSKGRVFFDVNTLRDDGTTAVSAMEFTKDGSVMAVGLSEAGSDYMNVMVSRVKDTHKAYTHKKF